MNTTIIPFNHYFYTSAEKVYKVCKPFFTQHSFSFFDYGVFSPSGNFHGLTTNADSFRLFFELQYKSLDFCKNKFLEENRLYYFFLIPMLIDRSYSQIFREVLKITGSDHGFSIIRKRKNLLESYYFASSLPGKDALNFYLNQIDTINYFLNHFQIEALQLIRNSAENSIILPQQMFPQILTSIQSTTEKKQTYNIRGIILTKRENDCLDYLYRGFTIKETAIELNLSARTIETHLNRIKEKFNIKKKADLIKYFSSQIFSR